MWLSREWYWPSCPRAVGPVNRTIKHVADAPSSRRTRKSYDQACSRRALGRRTRKSYDQPRQRRRARLFRGKWDMSAGYVFACIFLFYLFFL